MEQQEFGTITYYEPSTKKYAALGHGIIDIDTGTLINISSGELVTAKILSIIKGKKDSPRRNKRKYCKPEKLLETFQLIQSMEYMVR